VAVVHADEGVDHFQAAAAFVTGSGVPPERASGPVIMYLDPQVVPGAVQPHADDSGAVPQRVGHQLAADQHGVVDVIVEAPRGQRLADEAAGLADLGRVTAELAASRTLLGDGSGQNCLLLPASSATRPRRDGNWAHEQKARQSPLASPG